MSLGSSFSGLKASLTLEAAMVIPLFLFFLINLISVVSILGTYSKIQSALHQTGMKMATYTALGESANEHLPGGIGLLYAKAELEKTIGEAYLKNTQIKNREKGLQYFYSQIMNTSEEVIDIVVSYSMQPFIHLLGFGEFQLINRCRIRGFTGYDNTLSSVSPEGEEVVYITNTGVVYHRERTCSYLKMTISKASKEVLADIRNYNGAKYYFCEICEESEGSTTIFFITEYGDRYHTSMNCSALKRIITEVLISEVENRKPCSKCGG